MVDPADGLASFQQALAAGVIAPRKGEIHPTLLVLRDEPNGKTRLTYALIKKRKVVATAVFVPADPIKGHPCLNAGYAVNPVKRSRGYGQEIVQKAFDELVNGFKRAGVHHLYVEAIVSTKNEHSNKLASKLFSLNPKACTDSVSGEPAYQYVRQLF